MKNALLIIDMQQGLFHGPHIPYAASSVLSNIRLLIKKARASGTPLFFARHTGPDGSPFSEQSPLTQLIPELNVNVEQDSVFIKKYPNCFRDTVLLQQLKLSNIDQLVIAGMKTEICVDTTCRAAFDAGFKVVLVSDAHTTIDNPALTADNIIRHHNQTLAGPFVSLVSTEEWVA
ncbi:Isochorismatase [Pantoea sp. AS-PWVM4]|uniref:cysteine hydrolase family protein n=1 Tax=Pantoea sp. AS-PWVM4 TaxID=1332069 RepID=UPI0003AC7169|nr:cysteine hydrolase family protein [Pantoea sp. AS-PWVM4]ERK16388.1 Isochorismatase [Pantoea sp. AS-PWVM4]